MPLARNPLLPAWLSALALFLTVSLTAAGPEEAPPADALPAGAVVRLGTSRFWLPERVMALAVSPDGKAVASLDAEDHIRLWETATGKLLGQLSDESPTEDGPPAAVGEEVFLLALRFSPDGKHLAVGYLSGRVRLWDLITRKPGVCISAGAGGEMPLFAFAPDGKTLATAAGKKGVRLWSVATGMEVRKIEGHKGCVSALAYSADGRILATGGEDHTVRLWDPATGKELRRLTGHRHIVQAVAVSRDGKRVASVSADTTLRIWDADTGKELCRGKGGGTLLAFSVDGTALVEAHPEQGVLIRDVATGRPIRGMILNAGMKDFGRGEFQPFALSADGRLAVRWEWPSDVTSRQGGGGGRIRVTDVFTGKDLLPPGGVTALAWSPDGRRLASGGADCRVIVWDVGTGKELARCEGHTGPVTALAFHPGGGMVASACDRNDRTVSLWDARTGKEVRQFVGATGPGRDVSFDGYSYSNPQLLFSPDGKWLVGQRQTMDPMTGVAGSVVRVWAVASGDLVKELNGHTLVSAFRPGGKALVGLGYAKTQMPGPDPTLPLVVRQWAVGTWKETEREVAGLWSARTWGLPGFSPVLSPDARVMARLEPLNRKLVLWDIARGKPFPLVGEALFQPGKGRGLEALVGGFLGGGLGLGGGFGFGAGFGGRGAVCGQQFVSFAPDRRSVATALSPDGSLQVWELAGGGERCELPGHPHGSSAICFAPDGRRLASGGIDGSILVWDTAHGIEKGALTDKALGNLWADLAAGEAGRAYRALCRLEADPGRAVPFLRTRLRSVPRLRPGRLARLIAELAGGSSTTREAARKELQELGERARPALEKVLDGGPEPKLRRRVEELLGKGKRGPFEELLGKGKRGPLTAGQLRQARAVEALGHIATPEARQVLEALARGAPRADLTRLARESLERVGQPPKAKP